MTYAERKRYIIYVSAAFITGAVLYGGIGLFAFFTGGQQSFLQRMLLAIGGGLAGGYLISSILSGILLFSHYLEKKSVRFRVITIVFFMITIQVILIVGIFLNIPIYLINLLQVIRRRHIIEK
ncbi:hypothetical protein [Candidatus Enterococcus ferrettii]|uniref:DUF4064 domain-containing protein n=1 Tax=Candidatus Enterococcus ferrettii TaxID=2815324 RepID=A0ABV0EUH7_9ENTE|nr:hypothetical protein [Enterococcus sp. 665A]MBO1339405.1 hypothetical protein [Enterococcus sp. 665A]